MRLSRDELLEWYPSWNECRHDIVKAFYGDIPLICWNKEYFDWYSTLTGTLSNIEAVNAYMWSVNGDYNIYRTLIGEVSISTEGKVLCGDVDVKYRGQIYNVILNLMYGKRGLTILRLKNGVVGFSNKDGQGSPSIQRNTRELEPEVIQKVLTADFRDYGSSIRKFMREAIKLYNEDSINHIMGKCFSM